MPPSVSVCMLVGGWVVESPSTNRVLSILDIKWTDRLDLSVGNCVDVGFLSRVHPPSVGLRGKTQSAAIHADPAAMIWADDGHVGIITHPPPQELVLDPYCWVMKSHSWEGWAESQSGKPQKRWWCERVPLWGTDDEDLHSWTRWRFAHVPNLQVLNSLIEGHTFIVVLCWMISLLDHYGIRRNCSVILPTSAHNSWLYGIMWLLYSVDIVVWFSKHCMQCYWDSPVMLQIHCLTTL